MNDLKLQKARDEKVAQQQLDAAKEQAALLEEKIRNPCRSRLARAERHSAPYPARKSQLPRGSSAIWKLIKRKIQLPESIKTFGMHEVPVKLHPQVTGKLHVKVVEA